MGPCAALSIVGQSLIDMLHSALLLSSVLCTSAPMMLEYVRRCVMFILILIHHYSYTGSGSAHIVPFKINPFLISPEVQQ
jgi:hypothetical protein